MITNLQIRHFRKNERLAVSLDRITVFRGPCASGKSSLIGALKWLVTNQPPGTEFIHWDHSFTAVRILCDGHTIIRRRSKKHNTYCLNGRTLKAFGTAVPQPVRDRLNMSSLNFQRQHDGPFWFRETAGEVARRLNAIINLELIDTTLANLDRFHRETKVHLGDVAQRVETARGTKARLRYVLALERRLGALNERLEAYRNGERRAERLSQLIAEVRQYETFLSHAPPDVRPLMKMYSRWQKVERHCNALAKLLDRAEEYQNALTRMDLDLHSDERKLRRLMGKTCPLCGHKLTGNDKM